MPVVVARRLYEVATKPGVFAHGHHDPAQVLLVEHAQVQAGDVVVHMNCGNGLFGAATASMGVAGRVALTDRNIISVEAARRTIVANGVTDAEVRLGHGAYALPADLRADVVAIRIPHEKLALLQLLTDAFRILHVGGHCYVAGANNEGAKSAAKALERLFGNAVVTAVDSGHRIVVATKRSETRGDATEFSSPFLDSGTFNQLPVTLRGAPYTLYARPGVFSWDHADEATELLAKVMQVQRGDSVLDLGCGVGALGVVAGTLSVNGRVCMVDADVEAVRCATRTAERSGLTDFQVLCSDVASAVINERFDVVVTNPPFHVGKATDLSVPKQFIHDAWEVLVPGGRLFLVANRTLPYERMVQQRFGNLTTAHDGQRFKVLAATKAWRL